MHLGVEWLDFSVEMPTSEAKLGIASVPIRRQKP